MTHRVKILQLDSTVAETVNYIQGDVRIQLRQGEGMEQSFAHGSQRSLRWEVLSLHAQPGYKSWPEESSLWHASMATGNVGSKHMWLFRDLKIPK